MKHQPDTDLHAVVPQDAARQRTIQRHTSEGYLTDHYAILGVSRDADGDTLKAAHRKLVFDYHPDRYEHLAPEFKKLAERRIRHIQDAYDILSDPKSRAEFDYALDNWDGPVSRDGVPVVSLSWSSFDPLKLIHGMESNGILFEQAKAMTGFSPEAHEALERLYRSTEDPDSDLVIAFKESLERRQTFLQVKEGLLRSEVGLPSDVERDVPQNYLEARTAEIEAARQSLGGALTNRLLDARSGRVPLLIESQGEEGKSKRDLKEVDEEAASLLVSSLTEKARQGFEERAEQLVVVASELAKVNEGLLSLVTGAYMPETDERFPKVVVVLSSSERRAIALAFSIKKDGDTFSVVSDELPDIDAADASALNAFAEKSLKEGVNVIKLNVPEGLNLNAILEKVLNDHVGQLFNDVNTDRVC